MINSTKIRICVCIPTFNEEIHLPFLLESIENQKNIEDYEIEIFISDSESSDETQEVACSYGNKSKFKYQIIINKDSNKSGNINKVLEQTASDIFIIVDAHCELDKYYIADGTKALIENQDIYCAVGGICSISPSPLRKNFVSRTIARAYVSPFGAGYSTFKDSGLIKPQSRKVSHIFLGFFKSLEMKEIGGFNEEYDRKQDIEFLERLKESTKKDIYQDNSVKIDYFLKQNTLREIGKRFFNQGQLIFKDRDSFRLKHIVPLITAILAIVTVLVAPQLFFAFFLLYISAGVICSFFEGRKEFLSIIVSPIFFGIFHFSYLLGSIYVLIRIFRR